MEPTIKVTSSQAALKSNVIAVLKTRSEVEMRVQEHFPSWETVLQRVPVKYLMESTGIPNYETIAS